MSEERSPRGNEWNDVIDVLGSLSNMITVRAHYKTGHPAIAQADDHAVGAFAKVLDRIPDLVMALVDGEFIVCERPLPDLRKRLHVLAEAMTRHQLECIVFQRGLTADECRRIGAALAQPADVPGRLREQTHGYLTHVILRSVVQAGDSAAGVGASTSYFLPVVRDALLGVARALATEAPIDKLGVLAVANQIVLACAARTAMIEQRAWTRSIEDEATHALNVATLTAMMMLEAGYPQRVCIDATAAALLHDIGHLFLPEELRGIPEPLLDERARPVFRNHTFAGAAMLLGAGCSALWVAAAFEHHRGVDGAGYPALDSSAPPHEIVRMIALANFFDSKRTLLQGVADSPDDALRAALALEDRYFGRGLVRRFLKVAGVFPPGTTVELTSLEPAIVMRANPVDPWRPEVKILRGPDAGKVVDLRDTHPTEARHRLSIVRAISPPLMVFADTVIAVPSVAPAIAAPESFRPPGSKPKPNVEAAARVAGDRARAALSGMDAFLDDLLTVPTDAFVAGGPPISGGAPPATYVAPPQVTPLPLPIELKPPSAPWPPRSERPPARMPSPLGGDLPDEESSLLARLGSGASVPRVVVADMGKLKADRRAALLLRFVDGASSIDQIIDTSGMARLPTLRLLEELLTRGVIAI